MAKPTFGQMEEFFQQVAGEKITSSSLQLFLDGLRKVELFSIDEYKAMIRNIRCRTEDCNGFHRLGRYDHIGGWSVAGYMEKQWLYTVCSSCAKATSLRDWGIPTNILKG